MEYTQAREGVALIVEKTSNTIYSLFRLNVSATIPQWLNKTCPLCFVDPNQGAVCLAW